MINLENRLWNAATLTAREAGMEFTVPCAHNIRDLIRAGVAVMQRAGKVGETDLELADLHLSKLTGEMVRFTAAQGAAARSGGRIKIRENALVQAKELCPLWPFG